jgi:hypothetical protein
MQSTQAGLLGEKEEKGRKCTERSNGRYSASHHAPQWSILGSVARVMFLKPKLGSIIPMLKTL